VSPVRHRSNDVTARVWDRNQMEALAGDHAASEERYRALFETMPQGIVHYDAGGSIIGANRAAGEILGMDLDAVTSWPVIPEGHALREDGSPFPPEDLPVRVALRTGETVAGTVARVRHGKTGELRWVRITAVPDARDERGPSGPGSCRPAAGSWHAELELRDGRVVDAEAIPIDGPDAHLGRLWLFRDATERRDRARQQERLLELEQAARQAAEAQTEQLQAYDKLRNDFVSSVSHALRTPLASISSAAQLLLSQEAPASTATRSYLEIIDRNADRLHQMVENLLLARRLDAGMLALDLAQVRVHGVIEEVAALLRPVALQQRVRLVVRSAAFTATADRERLADIVENLVGNAVKYTRPGTDVTVTASAAPGGWKVSVADHGPGIPPEQRRAVFGLFVRAADAERDGTRGSGLGLAITKGLVELHGGSIEVGDAPGGGAVFSCWFPAERPGA